MLEEYLALALDFLGWEAFILCKNRPVSSHLGVVCYIKEEWFSLPPDAVR
jgi:hypothetical protein